MQDRELDPDADGEHRQRTRTRLAMRSFERKRRWKRAGSERRRAPSRTPRMAAARRSLRGDTSRSLQVRPARIPRARCAEREQKHVAREISKPRVQRHVVGRVDQRRGRAERHPQPDETHHAPERDAPIRSKTRWRQSARAAAWRFPRRSAAPSSARAGWSETRTRTSADPSATARRSARRSGPRCARQA